MIRIFTTLAIVALLLMSAALLLGLYIGDLHGTVDTTQLRWATVHRMLGTAAAIVVVLVNSIAMTYFIGTSRWCKEVTETYRLDPRHLQQSVRLKRSTFPWAVFSMLAAVAVGALGAAADPATLRAGTEHWVTPHLFGAFIGLIFIALTFFMEAGRIAAHHSVIEGILAEVRRIRQERGLPI
ncbi:MAG: hypothetical protein IT427_02835 [Pirellulales bacterium]|nr:hypothetical protein [Pirellulales bacterium]